MKNPLIRLRESRNFVGNAERIAAEYFLENPHTIMEMNIREMAARIYVSPSTIIRLCQHLGFSGYREFRQAVIYELALYQNSTQADESDIGKGDSLESVIEKISYKNIRSLEETVNMIDIEKFRKCVDLICSCNSIFLFGIGASLGVARDAYLKFLRVNKPCFVNDDWHAQLIAAKNATTADLGIVISYSGETEEILRCMEALNANDVPTIAITRFAPSTIAGMASHVLYTSAHEALFRSGAISSRIAQLNVIDMLYAAYATINYDECLQRFHETHIEKLNQKTAQG